MYDNHCASAHQSITIQHMLYCALQLGRIMTTVILPSFKLP
jgi:hypothetical protein